MEHGTNFHTYCGGYYEIEGRSVHGNRATPVKRSCFFAFAQAILDHLHPTVVERKEMTPWEIGIGRETRMIIHLESC